jgi:histidyl-tRNA synthetase
MALIQPRTLKGFRDYLPEAMMPREWIIDTARRVYRSYGFRPIDTPALEYLEILTGKGSDETDKQLYRFKDHGGRDVGLRFDLTVPLARFVAQHQQELGLPFKRYHIATVWRGENTQAGRYREFMQCDFDTIGVTELTADIEMVLVINDLLTRVVDLPFTIRINHRAILNGLLAKIGLSDKSTPVLRALDKLGKIGIDGVRDELTRSVAANESQVQQVLAFASLNATNDQILDELRELVKGNEIGERGVTEISDVLNATTESGLPAGRVQIYPSIARGLDYYTGIVFETQLDMLPSIGSVASGGRYDNLADKFSKQYLPGVGASLGLDRLLAALEELDRMPRMSDISCRVLICMFKSEDRNKYLKLAAQLRSADREDSVLRKQGTVQTELAVEVYPEAKKLGKQLQYADRNQFLYALVLGEDEIAENQCQVKWLYTGESVAVPYDGTSAKPILDEIRRRVVSS